MPTVFRANNTRYAIRLSLKTKQHRNQEFTWKLSSTRTNFNNYQETYHNMIRSTTIMVL